MGQSESLNDNVLKLKAMPDVINVTTVKEEQKSAADENTPKSVDGKPMKAIDSTPKKGNAPTANERMLVQLQETMLAMKIQMEAESAKSQAAIAGLQSKLLVNEQRGGFSLNERETWVHDAEMHELESKLYRIYRYTSTGKVEHPRVHQLRLGLWRLMVRSLGQYEHLTDGIYVGDVRQLWSAVTAVAQANTSVSAHELEYKLRSHVKTPETAYPQWVSKLDSYYRQFHILKKGKTDSSKVMDVLCLVTDRKYGDTIRKIKKQPDATYEYAKSKLHAKAVDLGDLHINKRDARKTTNQNITNTRTDEKRSRGNRGKGKGGKGDKGDGRARGKGRGTKGDAPVSFRAVEENSRAANGMPPFVKVFLPTLGNMRVEI